MSKTITLERQKVPCEDGPRWDDGLGLWFAVIRVAGIRWAYVRAKGQRWRMWGMV